MIWQAWLFLGLAAAIWVLIALIDGYILHQGGPKGKRPRLIWIFTLSAILTIFISGIVGLFT